MPHYVTGRVGVSDTGDVFELTFDASQSPPLGGFRVVELTTATFGAPQTLTDGSPLPPGIWQIESGAVHATGGDATIRPVILST